jgi:hypothetical protein
MKTDPQLFNALVIETGAKAALPASVQPYIEKNITVTGKITTIAIDDFTNKKSSYEYYIQTPQQKYSFYPTSDIGLVSGVMIKVNGYVLDDQIAVNNDIKGSLNVTKDAPPLDSIGNQRTLVILLKSFPSDPEPFTPTQAHELVFSGQFQSFMQEQSYGKVSFSGDVVGWYVAGTRIPSYSIPEDLLGAIGQTYGINYANYDRVVYLLSGTGGGVSSLGKYEVTIGSTIYNIGISVVGLASGGVSSILSHEMGHSLGVMHANSWECNDGSILYGDCYNLDYGNSFDVMGSGDTNHYSSYFKERLGWLEPSQVLSIKATGIYTLSPLETNDSLPKEARIYIKNSNTENPYSLEFRNGTGYSSFDPQNSLGVFVNYLRISGLSGIIENNILELLDMSPGGGIYTGLVRTLNLSSSSSSVPIFNDPSHGISIGPVTNVSSSSVTFRVDIQDPESCIRRSPVVTYSHSWYDTVSAGGYIFVVFDYINQDSFSCGPSDWRMVRLTSSSVPFDINPVMNQTVAPDSYGENSITGYLPYDTLPGVHHHLDVDILNVTSGVRKTISVPLTVSAPLSITMDPAFGAIGTEVSVHGNISIYNGMIGFTNYHIDGESLFNYNLTTSRLNSNTSRFAIPATVTRCTVVPSQCSDIPTPPGIYDVSVYVSGVVSNILSFTVSSSTPPQTNYHPADTNHDNRISITELSSYGSSFNQNVSGFNQHDLYYASYIWKHGETYSWSTTTNDWNPAPIHPVDTNRDSRVSITELVTYGSAFRSGTPGYNQTDLDSATYIWKNGESYTWDSSTNGWNLAPTMKANVSTPQILTTNPTPTPTPTPTQVPVYSPTPTVTPSPSPTPFPTPTPTPTPSSTPTPSPTTNPITQTKRDAVRQLYLTLMQREPDQQGLDYWTNGPYSIDQIRTMMMNTAEYRNRINATQNPTPSSTPTPTPAPSSTPSPSSSPEAMNNGGSTSMSAAIWNAIRQYFGSWAKMWE